MSDRLWQIGGRSPSYKLPCAGSGGKLIAGAVEAALLKKHDGIVLVGARALNDPQSTRRVGVNPKILDAGAKNAGFDAMAKSIGTAIA